MKRISWPILLGLSLIVLSIILYLIHYAIFRDTHHIFIYMIGDIAFVPIEILLVTLIIHRLLNEREKRARLEKLNMVIGTFFSAVGTKLSASRQRHKKSVYPASPRMDRLCQIFEGQLSVSLLTHYENEPL